MVATVVGCLLRIVMAQGDLWLDEAWSLKLVAGLPTPWAVFWAISHDNNHFLNSFWLAWLGPERPAWAYRVPSVVFGTLAIPLAAAIGWRRGRTGAVVAAWLIALAMPLVIYGSEARGYAGLIASTLLAIAAWSAALDGMVAEQAPPRGRAAWILGLSIGFGTLCHLTMLTTLAVLALAAVLRLWRSGRDLRHCIDVTVSLFGPSLVCLLPAMAAIMAGITFRGGFEYGGMVPFAAANFAAGFGGILRSVLGLWDSLPTGIVFLLAGLLVLAAFRAEGNDLPLRYLGIAAVVALPSGMAALRLPNLEFPRYFLLTGLVILLLEADLVGRLWDGGAKYARIAAMLLLGAMTIGQAVADVSAIATGRGDSSEAIAIMAREGRPFYSSDSRFRSETVAEVAAGRQHIALTYVPGDRFCSEMPDWYIVTDVDSEAPSSLTLGPDPCSAFFRKRATFPASALSGMRWILYRRFG